MRDYRPHVIGTMAWEEYVERGRGNYKKHCAKFTSEDFFIFNLHLIGCVNQKRVGCLDSSQSL